MKAIKKLVILLFCVLNFFLIYALAYSPYDTYLSRLEYSELEYDTREFISRALTYGHMVVLLVSVVWSLIALRRTKQLSIGPVVIGLLTIIFLVWFRQQHYYPNGIHEFSKDGYRYRIETWYLDGENKYKRWKSAKPDEGGPFYKIEWQLDSVGLHH